jgi:hypothetical protein
MANAALIGAHAARVAAKERERVVDAFRLRGATAPERAVRLNELGLASDRKALVSFIAAGVVRGVDSRGRPTVIGHEDSQAETYYLDEGAYIAARDRRSGSKAEAVAIVLAIILLVLLVPLLFLTGGN